MGDHTHPCIEGKWATSTRGMVFINQFNFVAEVWYLLTIFTLVRKKHRTGGNQRGDHIQPPKEGMWATSAKILINYIHPSMENLIRRGNGESHSPHTEGNGPSLSEM